MANEPNTKFFLIGDGPLRKKIEASASDINVCFIGTVNNVSDYLNAMDGMILPSLFEGLPLVAIEWQLNGLPILISDTVTRDCALINTVRFMSLEQSATTWAEAILGKIKENNREAINNLSFTASFSPNNCYYLDLSPGKCLLSVLSVSSTYSPF